MLCGLNVYLREPFVTGYYLLGAKSCLTVSMRKNRTCTSSTELSHCSVP